MKVIGKEGKGGGREIKVVCAGDGCAYCVCACARCCICL